MLKLLVCLTLMSWPTEDLMFAEALVANDLSLYKVMRCDGKIVQAKVEVVEGRLKVAFVGQGKRYTLMNADNFSIYHGEKNIIDGADIKRDECVRYNVSKNL